MPVWAIVLVSLAAFGLFFLFCGLGAYFFEKSIKMRSQKQYIPHKPPITFDEYRMPQGVLDQLKKCREIMPIVRVKAVKQKPMPIDEQTREEIKKFLQENNTMANDEAKAKIDYSLKHKAESLVSLIDMFIQIELGRITCSDEIRDNTQELIKNLSEEILNAL